MGVSRSIFTQMEVWPSLLHQILLVHLMCTDHERCLTLLLKSHNIETPEYVSYLGGIYIPSVGLHWLFSPERT